MNKQIDRVGNIMTHVVVVGGGQAGSSLVVKLRNLGFEGDITLFCGEPQPPYQRPPLSKTYLTGEMTRERLYLRPEKFYDDLGIRLRVDTAVTAIDPAAGTILVGDEVINYDQLALTTGSDLRHLPAAIGGELPGVYGVRTLADVDAMAPEFVKGRRLLVVGGGYIGLEAASVAAKLGVKVTLVEMADRILQRVAAPETSDFFRELHQSHGVKILEATGLNRLTGENRIAGAKLSDGAVLDVDFAIVGVGISPCTHLAEAAGLAIENGIKTDARGQTSAKNIWAAGDCASFPYRGGRVRLESVPNAIDQAELVAENMLGANKDYAARPWFWSDQYDVKLQIAGLNTGYDNIVTRKTATSVSFWYFLGDTLLAVDAMNDARAYMIGKRLIEAGKSPDKTRIADGDGNIKDLL